MPKRKQCEDGGDGSVDSSGFRIPCTIWQPESIDVFLTRCERIMSTWRKQTFQQQLMRRSSSDHATSELPQEAKCTIDFDGPIQYDWMNATVTYTVVPNSSLVHQFQDGTKDRGGDHTRTLHHSTRDCFVAPILRDGLKTIGRSHEITGCWFRDTAEVANLDWRLTPLDCLAGCYISVVADAGKVRQRRRLGADRTRAVVEGSAYSTHIPVRCLSVTFRIPSPELEQWRHDMYNVCRQSIFVHGDAVLGGAAQKNAIKSLWGLLQHRLSYGTDAQDTGRWQKVHTISCNMAHAMGDVLRSILEVKNLSNRRKSFRSVVWQKLPVPFQEFLQTTYVGSGQAREFFLQDATFDPTSSLWVAGLTECSTVERSWAMSA